MSKGKRARIAKAQSSSKVRRKATRSGEHTRRANSKQARVLALLSGPNGATIAYGEIAGQTWAWRRLFHNPR
jgi:hypothetical protein